MEANLRSSASVPAKYAIASGLHPLFHFTLLSNLDRSEAVSREPAKRLPLEGKLSGAEPSMIEKSSQFAPD